jgi:hypothetical protein
MRVRAFRIVPNETDGNMMVDGEKVPYGNKKLIDLSHRYLCFF